MINKNLSKTLMPFFAAAVLAAVSACGDDSSSSPVTPSDSVESSSSIDSAKSSSSVHSSSSWSSEGAIESSSSFADELNCSMLLEGEREWNWDIPKECRFNPNFTYGTMTDSRDGQTYKTVKIGDQTWMAENLNFDPGQGGSGDAKYDWSWCYNDEPKNCAVIGRLYTWAAAIDSVKLATDADNPQNCGYVKDCKFSATVQGICPDGWHLPDTTEWNKLLTAVGGKSVAGKMLKSQTGWYDNGNGTDGVGFSVLPAGDRFRSGDFDSGGDKANFWSANESNSFRAYSLRLYYKNESVSFFGDDENYAFSVRCLKD